VNARHAISGLAVLFVLNSGSAGAAAEAGGKTPLAGLPPLPPSPIESFRRLLDLGAEEQARALVERPEAQRRLLQAKLLEYRLLPPDERVLRLDATELRWYLRPLMGTPPTNRAAQVSLVPEKYRNLVAERLRQWDEIDLETQQDILRSESTIRYVLEWQKATPAQQDAARQGMPPARRAALDRELIRWQALSEERRDRMCRRFELFFELPRSQRQKAIESFPDTEREQMEATLQAFARLPPAQRRACVASFRKFADLSPAERAEFLRSADRWKTLTPAEREMWRKLVVHLPPLPPGVGLPPVPRPPDRSRGMTSSLAPPLPR
jgi:hypothetical protein